MAHPSVLSNGRITESCECGLLNIVTLGCHRAVVSWKIGTMGTSFQGSTLVSPSFDCFVSCWYMHLKKDKCSSTIDLRLRKVSGNVSDVFLRIYLDCSDVEIVGNYNDQRLFPFDETAEQNVATFFETETADPNYFHPTDFLHLSLELELEGHTTKPSGLHIISPASMGTALLSCDILDIFSESKNCDVNLQADGKEFLAHRLILGARSSVFEAMFENDTEEKKSGIVKINDLSSETLCSLLLYMYSGGIRLSNVEETRNLYLAAEKFNIKELKERCTDFLVTELSIENAFDIAVFGDTNSDKKLVDSVKKYVREHLSLLTTPDWMDLIKNRPSLGSEILLEASLELTRRAGIVPKQSSEK